MKTHLYLLAAITLFASFACTPTEKKADVPPPPTAPAQQEAPAPPSPPAGEQKSSGQIMKDYASGLTGAQGKARSANAKVEMESVVTAVRDYQVDNGKYPATLSDIQDKLGPGFDLGMFNYDPSTGAVTLK